MHNICDRVFDLVLQRKRRVTMTKALLLAVLLMPSALCAENIEHYVNTAARRGGDGTTNAIVGRHRAFSSIEECEKHFRRGDRVFEIRNRIVFALVSASVYFSGLIDAKKETGGHNANGSVPR